MPGETTIPVVPCGERGDHPPHQRGSGSAREGMCPGVPPRHPDGSLVGAESPVPLAGELRALTDEVQQAQARLRQDIADASEAGSALRAEEYAVTVGGITCRVFRRVGTGDVMVRPKPGDPPAWWQAHIGGSMAQETMIQGDHGRSETVMIRTDARFGFNPDDPGSEQIALERAGHYCEAVATALAQLWREQHRIHEDVTDAVQRARVVAGALPES